MNNKTQNETNKTPLTNETFERIMKEYINLKTEYEEVENQRTDHRLNQLSYTNTWLFIIAMYCLFRFVSEIIPIILQITFIQYAINYLQTIFQ